MATVILDLSGTLPQTFTAGNWPRTTFDDGVWRFVWTPSTANTNAAWGSGFYAMFVANDNGGLWIVSDALELYDQNGLVISIALTWSAGAAITIKVDMVANAITISGATTGNGTHSFSAPGTSTYTNVTLGVGVYGGGGFNLPTSTLGDVDDAVDGGTGAAAGTSTATAVGGAIATGVGAAAGTSTVSGIAPSSTGAGLAEGTSTATAVGSSVAVATGSAAGTSTVTATSGDLQVGVGAVVQRENSTNPSTGTLSTWSTDLTISSVDTTADTLTSVGHGFIAGVYPGPFYVESTGSLPSPAAADTPYWVIRTSADAFQLATSQQNAKAGTAVNLTSSGSGTITLVRTVDTQASGSVLFTAVARGVWSTDSSAATDNKSNNYSDRDDEHAYSGFPGSRVRIRADVSATGGTAHTVSATWGNIGGTGDEITASLLEVRGATLIKQHVHTEVAIGSATITAPAMSSTAPAVFVVYLWGNGPVNQDHTWTPVDTNWVKHIGASAEADVSSNGYIQTTVFTRKYDSWQTGIAPQFQGVSNEGAQIYGYVVQAYDPPVVGESSGTSTAAAVGSSVASAAGSADGSVSASAAGSAVASAAGTSAGTSTADAPGLSVASADGASAGTSAATAAGQSTATADGASAGTSTASGVGLSITVAVGTSSASASASAIGAAVASAVATSAGTASAAAIASAVASAVASAAGTSEAAAAGASTAVGTGSAAGTSTATGAGGSAALGEGVGASAGTSTAAAVGAAFASAVGASDGTSAAASAGSATATGAGASAGTSTAAALGSSVAVAVGASSGVAVAVAVSLGADAITTTTIGAVRAALYAQISALTPTALSASPYVAHRDDAGPLRQWATANAPAAFRRFEIASLGNRAPASVSLPLAELARETLEIVIAYTANNRAGGMRALHDVVAADLRQIDYHLGTTRATAIEGATVTSRGYSRTVAPGVVYGVLPVDVDYWRAAA